MGVYDTIIAGDKEGQVKLWDCNLVTYRVGDKVRGSAAGFPENYSIAMREGGYVNIHSGILVSWTDKPLHSPVLDKYGEQLTKESTGLFGDSYVYRTEG